ncbi:hypothetical protein CLV98_103182 [Dyadobacter jejuensis]|uniref:Uncharacterized protein n=1 Tax=Dyadobacter jejuensis TaxID=1082580 RepID=A0A316AM01_9BACT|nr:hypothetical protein [Dyadobacter jejuensis]PWJ58815.1 hypothetical protein CLV98_103182 [Dyadobacter jejuensis]
MKNIYLLTLLIFVSSGTLLADQHYNRHDLTSHALRERVSIRIDELPEAVKSTLNSSSFDGWKIEEAFRVTRDDQSKYYEVKLKKDEQQNIVRLEKDGQVID